MSQIYPKSVLQDDHTQTKTYKECRMNSPVDSLSVFSVGCSLENLVLNWENIFNREKASWLVTSVVPSRMRGRGGLGKWKRELEAERWRVVKVKKAMNPSHWMPPSEPLRPSGGSLLVRHIVSCSGTKTCIRALRPSTCSTLLQLSFFKEWNSLWGAHVRDKP